MGDGSFGEPQRLDLSDLIPERETSAEIIVEELTGDAYLDAVIAFSNKFSVFILKGQKEGAFEFYKEVDIGFGWRSINETKIECIACVDVNDDGIKDIVTGMSSIVILSDGPLGWAYRNHILIQILPAPDFQNILSPIFEIAWYLRGLCFPDFNGDGINDIAALCYDDFWFTRFFIGDNLGGGLFDYPFFRKDYALIEEPLGVVCEDAAVDGSVGFITWGYNGATRGILTKDDTEPFSEHLFSQSEISGLGIADIDYDLTGDAICVLGRAGLVQTRLGKEDFAVPRTYLGLESHGPREYMADVTLDGVNDILLPADGPFLGVLEGRSDGTFKSIAVPSADGWVTKGTLGDFDNDGVQDGLTLLEGKTRIAFFKGIEKAPWFRDASYHGACEELDVPALIASGDFNGDGNRDVVLGHETTSKLEILFGRGDGTFGDSQYFSLPLRSSMRAIVPEDFNNDGILDLAVSLYVKRKVGILLGKGDGTFEEMQTTDVGPTPTGMDSSDLDGDGNLDIVVKCGSGPSDTIWTLYGSGDGRFAAETVWEGDVAEDNGYPETADLNGDGLGDILLPQRVTEGGPDADSLLVFLADAERSFGEPLPVSAGLGIQRCYADDFDGDGVLDCALTVQGPGEIRILKGLGDGAFEPGPSYFGGRPHQVAFQDFNGDGRREFIVLGGGVYVLLDRGLEGTEFTRGDINMDAKIDLADAIFMLSYLYSNGETIQCLDSADCNDDGKIDLSDAISVLAYLFGDPDALPEPFMKCGIDGTLDSIPCLEYILCQ